MRLIDQKSDFSAIGIGHGGLWTSVTRGIQALHELRFNSSKTQNNAVANQPNGIVIGAPTFDPGNGFCTMDNGNAAQFGPLPATGGLTLMVVVQNCTGGGGNDNIVGSYPGTSTTQGGVWFNYYNQRLTLNAYDYAYPATYPLSGYAAASAFMDMASGDLNLFEMFFGVLEDNVSMRLYRPRTGAMVTTATVGRAFAFNGPFPIRMLPTAGTLAHEVAAYGHWNVPLAKTEMDQHYSEIKAQAALYGLTIS